MKIKAFVALLLFLCSLPCFAQTFMIVATEIRDGQEMNRPFASQEGMIEGMFDSGFVSFDTGLYAPALNWRSMDFQEPLDIARQGLAHYLLAAEVRSVTEPRDKRALPAGTGESPAQRLLKIETSARCYLFDVRYATVIGEAELDFNNESPDKIELTYGEFLHSVGRSIASRGIEMMIKATGNP